MYSRFLKSAGLPACSILLFGAVGCSSDIPAASQPIAALGAASPAAAPTATPPAASLPEAGTNSAPPAVSGSEFELIAALPLMEITEVSAAVAEETVPLIIEGGTPISVNASGHVSAVLAPKRSS